MAQLARMLIFQTFFVYSVTGEVFKWCGVGQSAGFAFKPVVEFYARSEIHCLALSYTHKNAHWVYETVQYTDGLCSLYVESTLPTTCTENRYSGYWSRNLSTQDWIPIFRAYNGSGLEVLNAWNSSIGNVNSDEGASPLLVQKGLWPLIKELKVSMHSGKREVTHIVFNASVSRRCDWFSPDRIMDSPYFDITDSDYAPKVPEYFSVEGCAQPEYGVFRRFYAFWYHNRCPNDRGWIAVLDQEEGVCEWEKNGIRPSFMYSSGNTSCLYTSMDFAEMFLISARF